MGLALTGGSFLSSVWGLGWGVLWVVLWDSRSAEALKKEECREEGEEVGEWMLCDGCWWGVVGVVGVEGCGLDGLVEDGSEGVCVEEGEEGVKVWVEVGISCC